VNRGNELEQTNISSYVGLYVHIPFCKTKCIYCDFNCYAGKNALIPDYVLALGKELVTYSDQGLVARTLYMGGGTPSLLSPSQVLYIVGTARDYLRLIDGAEITMEANPGTVSEQYFRDVLAVGVNRISIGIQSFKDDDLRRLARHHTVEEALEAYRAARAAGFENISVDLIYGLPFQTLDDWRHNLSRVVDIEPDHISLYALTVEEGTPLYRLISRGKLPSPDDDLMADMYELAQEVLEKAGYIHYEISNWCIPGKQSKHNMIYWREEPFIGAGAGAYGFLNSVRYYNELLPSKYISLINNGQSPIVWQEELSVPIERSEYVILHLRLAEGVNAEEFQSRYGQSLQSFLSGKIDDVAGLGLVEWKDNYFRLTPKGRLLSNEVFVRILPD